jgi:hypothetical protein
MAQTAQEEVVRQAVAALLRPWLDDSASRFQKAVASSALSSPSTLTAPGSWLKMTSWKELR